MGKIIILTPDYKRDHPPIGLAASEIGMHDEREPFNPTQEWLDNLRNSNPHIGSRKRSADGLNQDTAAWLIRAVHRLLVWVKTQDTSLLLR